MCHLLLFYLTFSILILYMPLLFNNSLIVLFKYALLVCLKNVWDKNVLNLDKSYLKDLAAPAVLFLRNKQLFKMASFLTFRFVKNLPIFTSQFRLLQFCNVVTIKCVFVWVKTQHAGQHTNTTSVRWMWSEQPLSLFRTGCTQPNMWGVAVECKGIVRCILMWHSMPTLFVKPLAKHSILFTCNTPIFLSPNYTYLNMCACKTSFNN